MEWQRHKQRWDAEMPLDDGLDPSFAWEPSGIIPCFVLGGLCWVSVGVEGKEVLKALPR